MRGILILLKNEERRNFMRCGVYVRVSTDDQRDNGYSIDSQLRMIKEYCKLPRTESTWLSFRCWKHI